MAENRVARKADEFWCIVSRDFKIINPFFTDGIFKTSSQLAQIYTAHVYTASAIITFTCAAL